MKFDETNEERAFRLWTEAEQYRTAARELFQRGIENQQKARLLDQEADELLKGDNNE